MSQILQPSLACVVRGTTVLRDRYWYLPYFFKKNLESAVMYGPVHVGTIVLNFFNDAGPYWCSGIPMLSSFLLSSDTEVCAVW